MMRNFINGNRVPKERGDHSDLYSIPVLGSYLYRSDRVSDLRKMDADFRKNTGRTYAYRTDSYGARASRDAGDTVTDAMRLIGRQYRRNV